MKPFSINYYADNSFKKMEEDIVWANDFIHAYLVFKHKMETEGIEEYYIKYVLDCIIDVDRFKTK